jgi:hypothetical protein
MGLLAGVGGAALILLITAVAVVAWWRFTRRLSPARLGAAKFAKLVPVSADLDCDDHSGAVSDNTLSHTKTEIQMGHVTHTRSVVEGELAEHPFPVADDTSNLIATTP